MTDVTRILSQIESGDSSATGQLLPRVYEELRKLAAAKLAHEKPGQTLQATALAHEGCLRSVNVDARRWDNHACLPPWLMERGRYWCITVSITVA